MIREKINITASEGLHARPAAALVKSCSKMDSNIHIKFGEKSCNAKSMMAVLKMGIKKGSLIEIEIDGGDESNNMQTVMNFINREINV